MLAAVLGIGTELTDGQIINRNAAWISARLKNIGLVTKTHVVVPDQHDLILEALQFCSRHADLLFVTGGLGPTTDDFTRDLISQWTNQPLQFDPASWQHLSDRLTSRGYTVKEIQRQQCYFPEGARILTNPEGTANAFYLQHGKCHVFVLPGPPREIEALWKSSIHDWLQQHTQNLDPYLTRKWDVLGLGESDVATLVEEALVGISIDKGYRVHLPYVEVKVSYLRSQEPLYSQAVQKVENALKEHVITRDGEDVGEILIAKLGSCPSVRFIDEYCGTFLLKRLTALPTPWLQQKSWSFSNQAPKNLSSPDIAAEVTLTIEPVGEKHQCKAVCAFAGNRAEKIFFSPYKTENMKEREQQYFAECALSWWASYLPFFNKA